MCQWRQYARGPWPSSARAGSDPDSNRRQAAAVAGGTSRFGVLGEAPPARPRDFERAAGRAAAGSAEPLQHLTAGAGCEVKRTGHGQAISASVELIFQFSLNFYAIDHG